MSKKIYSVLLVITVSIFFSLSTASAYELNWNDQLGTSETIGGFQLVQQPGDYATVTQHATGAIVNGQNTVQSGDTFTEQFKLSMINPLIGGNNIPPTYLGSNIFKVNAALAGYTDVATNGVPTTYYTSGSGSLSANGTDIMTFDLNSSTPSTYSASIFSPVGIHANVSLGFLITDMDAAYFQALPGSPMTLAELITNKLLTSSAEGNFALDTATYNNGQFTYTYNFTTDGVRTNFNVVPEPATLMLFGLGLIGLACIARKKNQLKI
jgi:hypothetical protein